MKLVVGLGNIGEEYTKTRHNIGFTTLDEYAQHYKLSWKNKPKLHCQIAQSNSIVFIKPITLMNRSGRAVRAVTDYYQITPENVLVVSDDIDRKLGEVRIRNGGGDGGHNGLKNIASHIGSEFWRLRVGIANNQREQINAADFVLSRFNESEQESIEALLPKLAEVVDSFANGTIEANSFKLMQE